MKILNPIDLINFIKRIAPHKKKWKCCTFNFTVGLCFHLTSYYARI